MNYFLIFALIAFSVGGVFSALRQLQMFQQNSYYPSRYLKWLKSSKSPYFYLSLICLVAALCLDTGTLYLPILATLELVIRIIKSQKDRKKSIKKLVYTSRVKRLIVTLSLFYLICSFVAVFPYINEIVRFIFAAIVIVFGHLPQIPVLLSNLLNKPIENTISNGFIKDAKRILKQNNNLTVIGVTGSFGKTSVKFMLNRLLSEKYNTLATPESFNTPMGVVKTIRESLTPATEIFIAEMGAKNIGDIKELCDIVDPDYGIITAVGPQHLETFKTIQNVANTKFELADACLKKGNGKVYVNFDSTDAKEKAASLNSDKIISYGDDNSLARAEKVTQTEKGTEFTVLYKEHNFSITTKLLGRHNLINLLGAIALALDFGVSEAQIRYAVSSIKAPPHRLEIKGFINGATLIDDAYNSNPVGCLEAVNVLGSFEGKKRIIVTPGLIELGDKEYDCNYNLGTAAADKCDAIILVGQKRSVPMKDAIVKTDFNQNNLYVADSFLDAMKILREITDENSVVLFENDLPDNYAG